MRHLLAILACILLIPSSIFAIDIGEINGNSKYVDVFDGEDYSYYVDKDSVEIVRGTPPHYELTAKVYYVNYKLSGISESTYTMYYDYDNSMDQRVIRIKKQLNTNDTDTIRNAIMPELAKDTGMTCRIKNGRLWKFDGTRVEYTPSNPESFGPANFVSPAYQVANFAFWKKYHMYFQPNMPASMGETIQANSDQIVKLVLQKK